nr:hypothetical protein [Candidatus Symbiopectobacterium sp.]
MPVAVQRHAVGGQATADVGEGALHRAALSDTERAGAQMVCADDLRRIELDILTGGHQDDTGGRSHRFAGLNVGGFEAARRQDRIPSPHRPGTSGVPHPVHWRVPGGCRKRRPAAQSHRTDRHPDICPFMLYGGKYR